MYERRVKRHLINKLHVPICTIYTDKPLQCAGVTVWVLNLKKVSSAPLHGEHLEILEKEIGVYSLGKFFQRFQYVSVLYPPHVINNFLKF
jgi:hypothetical protein